MKKYKSFIKAFKAVQREAHQTAIDKGWWLERDKLMRLANKNELGDFARKAIQGQMIALMHSELSEGLEGLRKNLMDDKCPQFPMIVVELADDIIRKFDFAEGFNLPLAEAIVAKLEMNKTREHKHGGKAF